MKKIGVLTSGGDAPGMNAAIRAVVRTAIYQGLEIIGFERGYAGLIAGQGKPLNLRSVSGIINSGGTILKTVRCPEMKTALGMKKAVKNLKKNKIQGLVVIGGDGSFQAACYLHRMSKIAVVGIPATIDNDVFGTDTTIGFDTAVNTALAAIDKIRDTATSHERLFIIEVMGNKSGLIAQEVGLASGAEVILVPEIKYDLTKISKQLQEGSRRGKTSSIIVMAEGAGNPIAIGDQIKDQTGMEVRVSILGYIQRGGRPTAQSRVLASRLGNAAVGGLLKGMKCKVVGVKSGRIIFSDLGRAWRNKREIDKKMYKLAKILAI